MRWLSVAALACLPACAQIFGIEDTTGAQAPGKVTLAVTRESIGATVISAPQDVTAETATFFAPDAIPGVQSGINTWQGDVPTGFAPVEFTLPDLPMRIPHVLAVPSRDMRVAFVQYEHPDPQPPPMSTIEQVDLTLPTAYDGVQTFQIYVIGAWMKHVFDAKEVPAAMGTQISAAIPYSTFTPQTASPAAAIAAVDAVLVLRYTSSQLTGVYQQAGFDQSTTMDSIGGANVMMAEIAADKTMAAPLAPATLSSRFQTVRPGVTAGSLAMSWQITAAPGYQQGAIAGPILQAGSSVMADTMVSTSFGNPFESLSWPAMFLFVATETRTFSVGAATATLYAQMTAAFQAPANAPIDLASPLPEQISIDAHQLNSDGSNVPLDVAAPHEVTMIVEATPAPTLYFVNVIELVVNANIVDRKVVLAAQSTDPMLTLPPGTFTVGSTYTLDAGTVTGGVVNAATGDLVTSMPPFNVSQADSGIFTVVAP